MSYRIKDLSVTVLPKEVRAASKRCLLGTRICVNPTDLCLLPTSACRFPTDFCHHYLTDWCRFPTRYCRIPSDYCHITDHCIRGTIPCFGGTVDPCGITFDPCGGSIYQEGPLVINEVAEIDALREELNETIARLDQIQEAGLESVQFDSAEEAAELEQRLEEALDAIRKQRKKAD